MKRLVVLILLLSPLLSFPQNTWSKIYQGNAEDDIYAVQQTKDGGYILTGKTSSFGLNNYDILILKLNAGGNAEWAKTIGGDAYEDALSIEQTKDGGYIVAGESNKDIILLKLTEKGAIQWQKIYGAQDWEWASSVTEISEGGYLVAGATRSFGSNNFDYFILKLDSTGEMLWGKFYGDEQLDLPACIKQAGENGYLIAGATIEENLSSSLIYILRLDVNGKVLVGRKYESHPTDIRTPAQLRGDSIVVNEINKDALEVVYQSDMNGNIMREKIFLPPKDSAFAVSSMDFSIDKSFIVAGTSDSENKAELVKLSRWENKIDWIKYLNLNGKTQHPLVTRTADSCLLVAGAILQNNQNDIFVIKVKASGEECMPVVRGSNEPVANNEDLNVINLCSENDKQRIPVEKILFRKIKNVPAEPINTPEKERLIRELFSIKGKIIFSNE